jgi:hypothetical protein
MVGAAQVLLLLLSEVPLSREREESIIEFIIFIFSHYLLIHLFREGVLVALLFGFVDPSLIVYYLKHLLRCLSSLRS